MFIYLFITLILATANLSTYQIILQIIGPISNFSFSKPSIQPVKTNHSLESLTKDKWEKWCLQGHQREQFWCQLKLWIRQSKTKMINSFLTTLAKLTLIKIIQSDLYFGITANDGCLQKNDDFHFSNISVLLSTPQSTSSQIEVPWKNNFAYLCHFYHTKCTVFKQKDKIERKVYGAIDNHITI